ncbi:TMEM165/GDT1 family protein [Desulfotruncus alcoholivorax]|uniref:TMEM165/GDT1 family protein n=1 Tax=Desulfotruncus alcoholivorax TaxID=265477 RepID=UPI0006858EED|nr:TMEM165/GDT1 family protein [Desulfotruncus alcoholivorax]
MSMKLLTWLTTYIIIILAELGDKTQVAVLLFTSNNPNKKWLIFVASALALTLCVLIEVTVGVTLAKHIGPAIINRATGVIFLLIGVVTLLQHFKVTEKIKLNKEKFQMHSKATHNHLK